MVCHDARLFRKALCDSLKLFDSLRLDLWKAQRITGLELV